MVGQASSYAGVLVLRNTMCWHSSFSRRVSSLLSTGNLAVFLLEVAGQLNSFFSLGVGSVNSRGNAH